MDDKSEKSSKKIPSSVERRLFLYYRTLLEFNGFNMISSEGLSELSGFTAAQIRKDLTYFGQFGTPGRGYNVDQLKEKLLSILGIDREWNVALIGLGNLGRALLSYEGFQKHGFKISAVFDNNPDKIGLKYKNVLINDISELENVIQLKKIKIAVIAVPVNAAQSVVNKLIVSGVEAILNFVPCRIKVPDNIKLLNLDMAIELGRLSYYMTHREKKRRDYNKQ
jgi:redox-sensing transcriptional repressor